MSASERLYKERKDFKKKKQKDLAKKTKNILVIHSNTV